MIRPLSGMLALTLAATALAQNQPTVEQLQSDLADARKQLAASQDRKNELAAKNAELQKRLDDQGKQLQDKQEELSSVKNRAYFLRSHYAAWEEFVDAYPDVKALWTAYYASEDTGDLVADILGPREWPFMLPGE